MIRIDCEKSEEQAHKKQKSKYIFPYVVYSWSSPPKSEEQKQNQKILKKVLDKSAKPLYC